MQEERLRQEAADRETRRQLREQQRVKEMVRSVATITVARAETWTCFRVSKLQLQATQDCMVWLG